MILLNLTIMYKNSHKIFWVGVVLLLLNACKEEMFKPLYDDGNAPGRVKEAVIENLNGAAKITTVLPDDDDLLYIKAVVEVAPGKIREFKASSYSNELYLDGFAVSKPYEVKLYAVDRGENTSEPLLVLIHPLTPPVELIYKSLIVKADFGGVNVNFQNVTEASVSIVIQIKDSQGDWIERETYYTKKLSGNFSARGLSIEEREFRVFVKDRWANQSETGIFSIKPLFEELIPKTNFKAYNLPGDTFEPHLVARWAMPALWDGVSQTDDPVFHTKPSAILPGTFTIDIGVTTTLSRMKLWGRTVAVNSIYNLGNIKKFEIWGSSTPPPASGEFPGNMILLGEFESTKPSKQPLGTNTSEDVETARAGEDFSFLSGIPPVRYIRIKVYTTWGGVSYWHIAEMTFWGKLQ